MRGRARLLIALLALFPAAAAMGAEPAKPGLPQGAGSGDRAVRPMATDEPMASGMGRAGMKKGDVMAGAKQKKKYMEDMMEREQAAAPSGGHSNGRAPQ